MDSLQPPSPTQVIAPEAIAIYRRFLRESIGQWQAASTCNSTTLITMAIALETELPLLSNELRQQAAGRAPLDPPIGADE